MKQTVTHLSLPQPGLSELKMDIERKSLAKPTGGTLRWTAPEILIGHRISFASDGKINRSH